MNRCNIPHAPSTGLSGTQFSTLYSAGINDPEGPEKYNNTKVKSGATSTFQNRPCSGLINPNLQHFDFF
jgi:hypothetical protein